jgi:PAS domain S-box-containing protein
MDMQRFFAGSMGGSDMESADGYEFQNTLMVAMVESSPVAMVLVDPTGMIARVNTALASLFGYTWEELSGQTVDILAPERMRAGHMRLRRDFLTQPEARPMGAGRDLLAVRKDGSEFPVEIGLTPIATPRGVFVVGAILDLTERLRKDKLAVLGQMADSVGHELRNPLGVMNNAVYFLKTVLAGGDPNTLEYLDIIGAEIASAERIVADLLDAVHTRKAEPQLARAEYLVRQALRHCVVPDQVTVEFEMPADLPPVEVDPQQMQRVFSNLIRNSIEAMSGVGTLTIRAAPDPGVTHLRIGFSDTGPGLMPEQAAQLFQTVSTNRVHGTGLGLMGVKNLVSANSGRVEVRSEPLCGATFTVVLPCAAKAE